MSKSKQSILAAANPSVLNLANVITGGGGLPVFDGKDIAGSIGVSGLRARRRPGCTLCSGWHRQGYEGAGKIAIVWRAYSALPSARCAKWGRIEFLIDLLLETIEEHETATGRMIQRTKHNVRNNAYALRSKITTACKYRFYSGKPWNIPWDIKSLWHT